MPSNLSHLDERGNARMVDVGGKDVTRREAVCRGAVFMRRETLSLIMSGGVAKGDVLAVARIAGIMAAKKTSDIIPLCHPISLTHCSVNFEVPAGTTREPVGAREESKKDETKNDCNPAVIEIEARVRTVGQTGAEMEAMTAVAVAGLAIYDMVKGVDRGVKIGEIRLIEKSGGKSGHYKAPEITASENGVVPCVAHTVSGTGGECVNQGDERSIGEKEDGQTRPARAIPFFANSSERLLEGIRVGIITASDKAARGERQDQSGPVIAGIMKECGAKILSSSVLPDDKDSLARAMASLSDEAGCDLILTTGGTGLGPRDVTPDATLEIISRPVPGIAERMRWESWRKTPHGVLSRAVAGIRKRSLIVNLPGSPRAAKECLESILDALPHALEVVRGESSECARLRHD